MRIVVLGLAIMVPFLAGADQTDAARDVMHRLLGRRADSFRFEVIPKQGKLDSYQLQALNGTVLVRGTSGVAMCRGAYAYLKEACRCVVTWDGNQVALPGKLPNFPMTEVTCPNQYRHYYNVCTFGYTTAFWGWKEWAREIDWMALHGINMPLAMNGEERVWEDVWAQYGLNRQVVCNFFTGPAFLPWHRMGNLNSHGGPMPQEWLDSQADLQKRILEQERALGMTPVVPGFSGFVPTEFATEYPRAKVLTASGWAGFPPTHQLDPRDPMFAKIQSRFIAAYTKRFGTDHLYLCDLYNEMTPTVSSDHRDADLTETGKAIYDSIRLADPEGTWVMQGWLFHNEPSFWKEPEIAAFLDKIPDDRMILLDLSCESAEIWRQSSAFHKKPFIWNLLHGFGGCTELFGDLAQVATLPLAALKDPGHGGMAGMGLTMEGINENAAIYELMCDTMWRTKPLDPADWMASYMASRYHASVETVRPVAQAFLDGFYAKDDGSGGLMPYQARPGTGSVPKPSATVAKYKAIVETMLTLPSEVQAMPLFQRDLVDATKRYVAEELTQPMADCVTAARAGNIDAGKLARNRFEKTMLDLDALLDTIPQYRMSGWIGMARSNAGDKDLLEVNARLQVTVWGGPELNDYAAKEWSGLVTDFYKARWDQFFDALAKPGYDDKAFQKTIADWELAWCSKTDLPRSSKVDVVAQVKKLLHQ